MRAALIAAIVLAAGAARADSLAAIIAQRATVGLPPDLAITEVHLSPRQAALDVAPTAVDVDFPLTARPGRASVRVRIGKKNVFVPVTLTALAEVAIATRDLAPGEIVADADVRWERRPVEDAAAVVIGAAVSAPIGAGQILDDARLTTPPAIARGAEVAVEVVRGAVEIATRGHLENAARIGAPVRVRLATGGLVTGNLIRADRVRVEAP